MGPDNAAIAGMLEEVADLLAYEDANPFRVRAFREAARTVRRYGSAMTDLVDQGVDLDDLPAIGPDISAMIVEAVRSGRMSRLDVLRRSAPSVVSELLRIPGVGPKRAHLLCDALGIASVDDLRRAVVGHRVRAVRGLGAGFEGHLLESLEQLAARQHRHSLPEAAETAEELVAWMRAERAVERIDVAGSFRRGRESVGDLDLLTVGEDAERIMQRFVGWSRVYRAEAAGSTRATVVLTDGFQIDLRVVPSAAYGAALVYFTGSKAHGVKLRLRARARGLKLNEYGLWRGPERIAGGDERSIYEALGLPLIPPELREDRGEIEAAEEGRQPVLVEPGDLRGDLHLRAATPEMTEPLVGAAAGRGLAYVGAAVTVSRAERAGLDRLSALRRWAQGRGGTRVFVAAEAAVLENGTLDLPEGAEAACDFVIGAVTPVPGLSRESQTRRLITAATQARVLSHLTGRRLDKAPAEADYAAVAAVAARAGCALELTGDPERLDIPDLQCRTARDAGALVVVTAEPTSSQDFNRTRWALAQARRGWLGAGDVLDTLSAKDVARFLARAGGTVRR